MSPPYVAVIVFTPAVVDVNVHVPAETIALHESVPSETVTVPVGVPPPGESTVVLQVTGKLCPIPVDVASAAAFVITVVVAALLTVTEAVAGVLLVPPSTELIANRLGGQLPLESRCRAIRWSPA